MPLTPEEIAELTADPSPLNPLPQMIAASPGEPGYGPGIGTAKTFDPFQSAPLMQRLGAALPLATMGFGAPTFLGRLGLNAAVGAGSEALKGSSPEEMAKVGGLNAALGGAAEKGGQFLGYLGSAIPKKVFDAAQEAKITDWLTQKVPWWNGLNLSEMATSTKAKDALRQGFDDAFTAAKEKIPGEATASIPMEVANALKLKGEGGLNTQFLSPMVLDRLRAAGKVGMEAVDTVSVNARDLLDKLPGSKGKLRAQILGGLEPIAGQVIPEAREAYRTGQGWLELANRGGIGKEGAFNAQTAQEALRKPAAAESLAQKALQPRGMGELENVIQGPLKEPITSTSPNSLGWHLGLGTAGALGGLGLHGLHGVGGALAALTPRPTFYRNVPPMLPQMMPQSGPLANLPVPNVSQGLRAVMPGFLSNMRSSGEE